VFTLSLGFAGPLLKPARLDGGGFHLCGVSSRGKTCAAQVAASVWGCGADPADAPGLAFVRRWNATTNALEGLAAAHSDGLLVLDELGTCAARDFGKAVYDLAGGQGKAAMDQNRNLKQPRAWRILLLSTGEIPARQKMEEDRRTVKAGQMLRLIDIPTGDSILSDGTPEPAQLVDTLKRNSGMYFGTAGPAFMAALIHPTEDTGELRDTVTSLLDKTAKALTPPGAGPEQARAIKKFALVAVAGILAVRLGVLPLTEKEITESIRVVLNAWLTDAAPLPDVERGVEAVRDFILRHQDARFYWLRWLSEKDRPIVRDLAGYWDEEEGFYLFTPEGFQEACHGHDPKAVARELARRGLLFKNQSDRLVSKHSIPGMTKRLELYAVRDGILEIGQEDK